MSERKRKERKVRVGKLDTVGNVVTEMAKIYREARRGNLETLDAVRLARVLCEIRRGLETNSPAIFLGGPIQVSEAKREFIRRIDGIRERMRAGEADRETE